MRTLALSLALSLILALSFLAPAHADDDQERARAALQAGKARPLGEVLALVARDYPGQVLEVDLEDHHERLIYEIKLLRPDGAITKLKVDARTGEVLSHRGRGPHGEGRQD